jgi:hypothetical protein
MPWILVSQPATKFCGRTWVKKLNARLVLHALTHDHDFSRYCASTSPYTLDLSPCNYFLFPRLKRMLKGRRQENIEAIKQLRRWSFEPFQKRLHQLFPNLQKCWQQCTDWGGDYFLGDRNHYILYRLSPRTLWTKVIVKYLFTVNTGITVKQTIDTTALSFGYFRTIATCFNFNRVSSSKPDVLKLLNCYYWYGFISTCSSIYHEYCLINISISYWNLICMKSYL